MHSRGSPTKGNKIRSGYLTLPSMGRKRGRKCYIAPAFSGVPNKRHENQKWLPHPCLLGGPKEGGNATSPLNSRGSPTKGNKIKSGYLALAFPRAQHTPQILRHPCILGGPQQKGTKSEEVASPLPSQRPKRGRKCFFVFFFMCNNCSTKCLLCVHKAVQEFADRPH